MSAHEITPALVRRLIGDQFPAWKDLAVTPVARQGWDNRTFRLGDELAVRLPSGPAYVDAVAKEEAVLRFLRGRLPQAIPESVGAGVPTGEYPHPWSVRRWLPGETVQEASRVDRRALAEDLGTFLTHLRAAPAQEGPAAGRHSHFRGCHPSAYSDQVQDSLRALEGRVDAAGCEAIWLAATTSAWARAPVWYHGDMAAGNLLVLQGRLSAVIDFGTCGVGDPACDLVMAWTCFTGEERQAFREAVGLDDDSWRRARGWALWKALVTLAGRSSPDPERVQEGVLLHVLADPVV